MVFGARNDATFELTAFQLKNETVTSVVVISTVRDDLITCVLVEVAQYC